MYILETFKLPWDYNLGEETIKLLVVWNFSKDKVTLPYFSMNSNNKYRRFNA
jgi:hypothetical protein